MVYHSHLYMAPEETIALTIQTFVGKVMSLLFNMLFWFVVAFFSRKKCLLISWLQSFSTVFLEPKKMRSDTVSIFPIQLPWSGGPDAMILILWIFLKLTFSVSSFTFIKRLFSSSLLPATRVVSSAYLRLVFLPTILIPSYESSNLAFCMMYSAYKLNKQGNTI